MFSASAFAANTIVRSGVAAAFPLFTVQMFTEVDFIVIHVPKIAHHFTCF
jgi:hypothetical protein